MQHLFKLCTAVFLFMIVTACAANNPDSPVPASDEIKGPALIVFYTDN